MVANSDEIYKGHILGRGSFGTVYKFQNKAIKKYHRLGKQKLLKFKLMKARKPKIKYTFLVEDLLYIDGQFSGVVYPYIEGENLYKIVRDLNAFEKSDLANQIIRNAKELTNNAIYPTDYRLPNIILDIDGNIRIIDLDDKYTYVTLFPSPLLLGDSLISLKNLLIHFLESDSFDVYRPHINGLEKYTEAQRLSKKLVLSYKPLQQYVDNRLKPITIIFINIDSANIFYEINLELVDKIVANTNCKIVLLGIPHKKLQIPIYDNIASSSLGVEELVTNYLDHNNITSHLYFDKGLLTKNSDIDIEVIEKSIEYLNQGRAKTKKLIRAKNL